MQEGLTWINGKNCTQIITRGHPHITKKVMHIKVTHLFELYIIVQAVNRELQNIRRISKSFRWFSKGLYLPPIHFIQPHVLSSYIHTDPVDSIACLELLLTPKTKPHFLKSPEIGLGFGEIMSPHSKISVTKQVNLDLTSAPFACEAAPTHRTHI